MTTSVLPEPTPVDREPRNRGPLRMIAALSATIIAAGAIAIAVNQDDTTPPRLALAAMGGGAPASEARTSLATDASSTLGTVSYVVDGTLPALADHGSVWKVVGEPVDHARVAAWARLLHIEGEVHDTQGGGGTTTEVSDSHGSLSVGITDQGTWVSMSTDVSGGSTGSVGSGGCAVAPASGAAGSGPVPASTTSGPGAVSESPTPSGPATCVIDPPTVRSPEPVPATDLPSPEAAQTIARDALTAMGVLDGDWTFATNDGGAIGIASGSACGPAVECIAPPIERYVLSRSVTATRSVEGTPVEVLEWSVEIGDHGVITSLGGQLASLERVGDYGLRTPAEALRLLESDGGGPVALGAPDPAIAIDCGSGAEACPNAPCPELCPEQLPITVHVTNVALGAQVWFGSDASAPTQYVVPMYRFTGRTDAVADWPLQALALNDDALAPPSTDPPVAPSSSRGPASTPMVKPAPPTTPR